MSQSSLGYFVDEKDSADNVLFVIFQVNRGQFHRKGRAIGINERALNGGTFIGQLQILEFAYHTRSVAGNNEIDSFLAGYVTLTLIIKFSEEPFIDIDYQSA